MSEIVMGEIDTVVPPQAVIEHAYTFEAAPSAVIHPRKQAAFMRHYFISLSKSQAAEKSGLTIKEADCILKSSVVKKQLAIYLRESTIPPVEIMARLSRVATASVSDYMDVDESGYWRINMQKVQDAGAAGIAEISYDTDGRPKLKMVSQLDAIEKLAKIYGMFTEKVEISVTERKELEVRQQVMHTAMADPELLRKLGDLAEALRQRKALPGAADTGNGDAPPDNA